MFANCILCATFCSMGTLVRRKKTWGYSARKVMEFGQLMTDILVYVTCKFEMYILKIAQIIHENVRIAFLYVLSIYKTIMSFKPKLFYPKKPSRSTSRSLKLSIFLHENGEFLQYFISYFLIYLIVWLFL